MDSKAILTVSGLALGYGVRTVAAGIAFSAHPGDCICIVGGNGTGKTTLLRTILGLQPPLDGTIEWNAMLRPGDIGYLPQQNPVQRDFPATALEVALSGCQALRGARPFHRAAERRLATDALVRFGAEALAGRSYRELSGGQRQRVLLARALCAGSRMLVLDEPATGLDAAAIRGLYSTIRQLRGEGRAILAVTHDLAAGLDCATHILEVGRNPYFGPVREWQARGSAFGAASRNGGAA